MTATAPLISVNDFSRGSGFEHFSRTVAPRRWREVFVQMLTACFDAGGKDTAGYKIISVAGFASFAGVWAEFEEKWQDRLREDHLEYFHAGDFAHSEGAFRDGWKGDERRRRALLNDLMEIVHGCGLRKFGTVLILDDYRKLQKKHQLRMEAFAFASMLAIEQFFAYAKGEGVFRNVRYVFEKGDPEDDLRKLLRAKSFPDPDFAWSKPHTDSKGFCHDPFMGLQAAGWIAYEYYLDAQRVLYGDNISDRWAFREFENVPGHVILRHVGEIPVHIPDFKKLADGVLNATVRLTKIKADKG